MISQNYGLQGQGSIECADSMYQTQKVENKLGFMKSGNRIEKDDGANGMDDSFLRNLEMEIKSDVLKHPYLKTETK